MSITVRQISAFFESWAPNSTKLDYDNVGLMVGNTEQKVTKILTCLDCTDEIIDEAIEKGTNLVVSHHPLIFKKLASVTNQSVEGRIVQKLIRAGISLLSVHTNLDAANDGVSVVLAEKLGLTKISLLHPTSTFTQLLIVTKNDDVSIPDWDDITQEKISTNSGLFTLPKTSRANFLASMATLDPGYRIISEHEVESSEHKHGFGAIGYFSEPMTAETFMEHVCQVLNTPVVRYSGTSRQINKVAVCGGSGSKLIALAKSAGADAYLTADITYHDFFVPDQQFLLVDTGHYENEFPIVPEMTSRLKEAFPHTEVITTKVVTNPVSTFISRNFTHSQATTT